jgi:tripartite-type tricarboxylate transporter receptor subunit TctC
MKYTWIWMVMAALLPSAATAQDAFPSKPIKVIVPFTPGAGSDIAARFFGAQMGAVLGTTVLVENRPGAFGAVAVGAVKAAPADGYTIFLGGNSPITVNPVVVADLHYDPVKELKPVSGLARNTNVFIVPPGSKLRTLADLVAAAKQSKQPLNAGTPASGYHLVLEWFANEAGIKFNHIPYKGGGQTYTDVAGGQIDLAVGELAGTAELIKTGKVHALAMTSNTRHPDFPDVPTVKESGYPTFVSYSWNSFYVRAETPDVITAKLAEAMKKVMATEAARQFVRTAGTELLPLGPKAMRKFQMEEAARFQSIADKAGIKPQ